MKRQEGNALSMLRRILNNIMLILHSFMLHHVFGHVVLWQGALNTGQVILDTSGKFVSCSPVLNSAHTLTISTNSSTTMSRVSTLE